MDNLELLNLAQREGTPVYVYDIDQAQPGRRGSIGG